MITAKEMQAAFYRHTFQRYELLVPNAFMHYTSEMDLVGLRKSGFIDEIEIKVSVQDFKADFKKTAGVSGKASYWPCFLSGGKQSYPMTVHWPKHEAIQEGELTNYFSFMLPEDIADQCDVPEYAGLYIARRDKDGHVRINEVRTAKRLNTKKITERQKYELARKMAYRYWTSENKSLGFVV